MNAQLFLSKIQMLPEFLQHEALDFVDYLLSKQNMESTKYSLSDEGDMEQSMEASAVSDAEEDYLTDKEVKYYLKLKDKHETRRNLSGKF